ncbi:MAG: hypothetical protein JWL72_2610 [Ilumatobacteraceae bacterium]|nr:hypothetical protein [Ilumatobacteraceae bacterium]
MADGPDADALHALGQTVEDAARAVERLHASIHLGLRGIYWFGEPADALRVTWSNGTGPAMLRTAERLRTMATAIGRFAVESAPSDVESPGRDGGDA